jgi:hypothetical protein
MSQRKRGSDGRFKAHGKTILEPDPLDTRFVCSRVTAALIQLTGSAADAAQRIVTTGQGQAGVNLKEDYHGGLSFDFGGFAFR